MARLAQHASFLVMLGAAVAGQQAGDDPGEVYRISGYVRGHHSDYTFDGTSVWSREPIAACSYNLALGQMIEVEGLGVYRCADRGMLGPRHIDILVDDLPTAYAITGWRLVWKVE